MSTFVGVVIVQLIGTVVFMTWIPAAAFAAVPAQPTRRRRATRRAAAARVLRVTFPLAPPAIIVAMILSFLASFDEAQGTYLVGNPDYITMPTQMYTLVLNYPRAGRRRFLDPARASRPSSCSLLVRKHVMGGQLAEGFQIR